MFIYQFFKRDFQFFSLDSWWGSVIPDESGAKLTYKTFNFFSAKDVRGIYWAIAAIFTACVIAGALVVNIAAKEANFYAARVETSLAHAELLHFAERAIQEQTEISYWDDAMQNLVLDQKPNKSFAREYFTDWLIPDMGFSDFVLVGEEARVKMVATVEGVNTKDPGSELAKFSDDLVRLARQRYQKKRYKIGSKYLVDAEDGMVSPNIQVFAFRNWNNTPSVIIAQVMIAESRAFAAGDGEETVLVSVKPITQGVIGKMQERLGLSSIMIKSIQDVEGSSGTVEMPDMAAPSSLVFQWIPSQPRPVILSSVAPLGVVIVLFLAVVLGGILCNNNRVLKELSRSEEANKFLANHDKLTGLANREKFEVSLAAACGIVENSGFAVMYIDLDRFKQANDTFGHHAGDAVLKITAERIKNRIASKGLVARIGGDEFVVLITQDMERDRVCWLADELIEDCSKPIAFEGVDIHIGASIGIAFAPRDGSNPDAIIKAADGALYQSKRNGRGRASIWNKAA